MQRAMLLGVTLIALVGLLPAASQAALHVPPTTATGSTVMVEGRVLSTSGKSFWMLTPAERVYCPPGTMCPMVIRAPERYEVLAQNAKIFGNYLGGLTLGDIQKGAEVVVYGSLIKSALPAGVASFPGAGGIISASAIFVTETGAVLTGCAAAGSQGCGGSGTYPPLKGPVMP